MNPGLLGKKNTWAIYYKLRGALLQGRSLIPLIVTGDLIFSCVNVGIHKDM